MKFPPEVLKCVAYLAVQKKETREIRGTTFFMSCEIEPGVESSFAITAKHVIRGIDERDTDGNSWFRLNLHGGGREDVALPIQEWRQISTTDLAIAPIEFDFSKYDHLVVPDRAFITPDVLEFGCIGEGEEVYFPGLFTRRPGNDSNLPIVRTGTIAALPSELIQTPSGLFKAYVIESRSIPGLSGSPMFVSLSKNEHIPDGRAVPNSGFSLFLLGIIQGHYDDENTGVNLGLSLAIPIDEVLSNMGLVADVLAARREDYITRYYERRQRELPSED